MPPFLGGVSVNVIERCGLEIRYLRVRTGPQRGRYVHQLVAEAMIGRPLEADEEVDHVNGDTFDNAWTNLQVVKCSEHAKLTRRRSTAKRRRRAEPSDSSEVPF